MAVEHSLAYKTAVQSVGTTPVAMVHGAVLEDTITAFNVSLSTTRHVVASAYNGRYGRYALSAQQSTQYIRGETRKNGSTFRGTGHQHGSTTGSTGVNTRSAPVLLTTADYFEAYLATSTGTSNTTSTPNNWSGLEILPPWFAGALVDASAVQAIAASTTTTLAFDQEVYDIGGWHDNSTNNSRLTVPSGVSLVRIYGQALTTNTAGQVVLSLTKNGSNFPGSFAADTEQTLAKGISGITGPIAVSATDYFDLQVFVTTAQNLPAGNTCWFGIEQLSPDLQYATAARATDFALSSGVTTVIPWTAENVDVGGWHDNSTNNSRLTVPSGVHHVVVTFNVEGSSVTGQLVASITKNGANDVGCVIQETDTSGTENINGRTAIIPVVPGDYFELSLFSTTARSLLAGDRTWFTIEEVKQTNLAISPTTGGTAGGTPVTITGGLFTGATDVLIDGNACTSFVVVNDSTITCVTPSGTAGTYNVVISRPTFNLTIANAFSYSNALPPTFTSITPDRGPTFGGTPVTIVGDHFLPVTDVKFGGHSATSIVIVDGQHITCVTPIVAESLVDIDLFSPAGNLTVDDAFTFYVSEYITQVPLLMVHLPVQSIRVTQTPLLAVHVPIQNTRITQSPVLTAYLPTPIPPPVPIVPEVPVKEVWQWKTIVNIFEMSREQRSALRGNPRMSMQFDALIQDIEDYRESYNIALKLIAKVFNYPMYVYSAKLSAAASIGDTKLYFNPAHTDLRAGGVAAFFDAHLEKTTYINILTVDVDGATLAEPLTQDVPSYFFICPAPLFRVEQPSFTMQSVSGSFQLSLVASQTRDVLRPNQANAPTLIDGLLLLDAQQLANTGPTYGFDQKVIWLDNEIANPEPRTSWYAPFMSGERQFLAHRPLGLDYWRAVASYFKGRQKAFLLPTFFEDLPLTEQPALGATVITSSQVQFFTIWRSKAWKYLRIKSNSGVIYRRILEVLAQYDLDGQPISITLRLSSSIGASTGSNVNMVVSFCNLCRLDSDEIVLEHGDVDTIVSMKIRMVEE